MTESPLAFRHAIRQGLRVAGFALVAAASSATATPASASPPAATPPAAVPAAAPVPAPLKQWLYVLKLVPRLHDDAAWTEADKGAVGDHFKRLKRLTAEGVVILAGRTREPGATTTGLVVFEAADEAAARAIMDGDPAVKAGVMTATLHPYAVALLRSTPAP